MDYRLFALSIAVLVLMLIVRQWKTDLLPVLRMAITLFFALLLLSMISPLVLYLKQIMNHSAAGEYTEIVLKGLGIALLTQCCSNICRECGENGIAGGVEMIGKIELLLLAIPLIEDVLELAEKLLSLGNG